MAEELKSTWCQHPFHALMITPTFEVRPCCRFIAPAEDRQYARSASNAKQIFENGFFNRLREQMRAGEWPTGCGNCRVEENQGLSSMRISSQKFNPEDNRDTTDLTQMELGVGRLCNLKCRSCGSHSSTKWEIDERKLGLKPNHSHRELDLDRVNTDDLQALRQLKVTGGEPMMHPQFERLLTRLADSGAARKIRIEVFTNATIRPSAKILSALAQFQDVVISLSVDAVGARGDYIRSPSEWNEVESVASIWFEWAKAERGRRVFIAATLSILNILYVHELIDWTRNKMSKPRFHWQTVHDPAYLSVMGFPLKVKARILAELRPRLNDEDWQSFGARFEKLLASAPERSDAVKSFFDETTKLDKIRGEDFASVFPELRSVLLES